jgi:hypothetical protein
MRNKWDFGESCLNLYYLVTLRASSRLREKQRQRAKWKWGISGPSIKNGQIRQIDTQSSKAVFRWKRLYAPVVNLNKSTILITSKKKVHYTDHLEKLNKTSHACLPLLPRRRTNYSRRGIKVYRSDLSMCQHAPVVNKNNSTALKGRTDRYAWLTNPFLQETKQSQLPLNFHFIHIKSNQSVHTASSNPARPRNAIHKTKQHTWEHNPVGNNMHAHHRSIGDRDTMPSISVSPYGWSPAVPSASGCARCRLPGESPGRPCRTIQSPSDSCGVTVAGEEGRWIHDIRWGSKDREGTGPFHTYSGPWGETIKRALVDNFFSRMHYISRATEYTYIDGLLNYKTPTRHIRNIPQNHIMIEGIHCSYTKDRSSKCQKMTIISSINLQNKQHCHNW